MLRNELLQFIANARQFCENNNNTNNDNDRIDLLAKFLKQETCPLIYFNRFMRFIAQTNPNKKNLFDKDYFNSANLENSAAISTVFSTFKTNSEAALLGQLHIFSNEVIELIRNELTVNTTLSVMRLNSFFKYDLDFATKTKAFWRKKLIDAGCAPKTISRVMEANIIQDYEALCRSYILLNQIAKINEKPMEYHLDWHLYVLSGEENAFKLALERLKPDPRQDNYDLIFLTCITGSIPNLIILFKQIIFGNYHGEYLLHYVALSGVPAAIDTIKQLAKQHSIYLPLIEKKRRTILHHAVIGGSLQQVDHILKLKITEQDTVDQYGDNALDYAISYKRKDIEERLRQLGLKTKSERAELAANPPQFHP